MQLGTLVDGYREALARFRDVAYADELPADRAYIPLFEALNWAAAIGHGISAPRPDVLRAIVYVRNAVHHEWLQALKLEPRAFGEGAFGEGKFGGYVWRWRPVEDIPEADFNGRRGLYEALLASRSALDTLRDLDVELGRVLGAG